MRADQGDVVCYPWGRIRAGLQRGRLAIYLWDDERWPLCYPRWMTRMPSRHPCVDILENGTDNTQIAL
eukprot:2625471-Prorocentrum_lima.AAC.1